MEEFHAPGRVHTPKSAYLAIFAQVLDLLEDYMRWKSFPVERIDGRIRGAARQVCAEIQRALLISPICQTA